MTTAPSSTDQISPVVYRNYLVSTFSLILLGVLTSVYLGFSHYKNYTDITYSSFCAISNSINCDTVSQSAWSIFLGLPVSYWGLFGYLLLIILLCSAIRPNPSNKPVWTLLFLITLFFSSVSIFLGYISASQIKAFCILCFLTYAINFTLVATTWMVRRKIPSSSGNLLSDISIVVSNIFKKKSIITLLILLALTLITVRWQLPQYWQYRYSAPSIEGINTGITEAGNPWIGSDDALLVIDEYSDYQCFQCAKMHHMLRRLIAKYPDKIKLIHHHYPLDHEFNPIVVRHPFHVGAGKMALIAIHALYIGEFWKVNDALFELGKQGESFSTIRLAEQTGLTSGELAAAITSSEYRKLLDHDIKKGMKLRITSTPTLIINDQIFVGTIPSSILEKITK